MTRRAVEYSQMTPEEQTAYVRKYFARPREKESLKTMLQRAEEMLKGPSVPPAP